MTLYLSRLELARSPSLSALAALIDPTDPGQRSDAHHRLLWSAFAGDPDARRDFLWREEDRGVFLTLSARPPQRSELFSRVESKEFAPDLSPGDRLAFALRANATRTFATAATTGRGSARKVHRDVVMLALHDVPKDERAKARMGLAQKAGRAWLEGQGARAGFGLAEAAASGYSVVALPGHRGARRGQPQFGILDLTGILTITDPAAFLARLAQGFGRAKAFGCGLMLIRRAA